LSFFNWNSNDTTVTNTAKAEAPPALFLSAQSCNTLEIPQAKPVPNGNAVAKDGSFSFSNIFHDLTSQPQFNMTAAREAKPAEQPTCIPQANETGQPAEALFNANQPNKNGDVPAFANQSGGNADMPMIIHQSGDDSLRTLSHQDGENHRLDCAMVVSEQLNRIDRRIGVTSNLSAMRNELTKNGWEQVAQDPSQFDPQQLQPGDVITGTRQPGMPGHAAIYLGGGMIYNNNSDAGAPAVESVDKFMQKQYNADGSFNKDGYSNVYIYRESSI
jgi:hypothetical protein